MSKEKFLNLVSLSNSSPSPFVGTKKYISTGDVDADTIKLETAIDITFDDRPSRANVECKPGDVLFAKMAETNKSLLIDDINSNYIFSTGFSCITPKANKLTSKCLFYLVSSPQFLTQKNKYSSGSTQKAINNQGLSKIFVDIPDLSEQQFDVEILDKINSLLKKVNKCIDLCDSIVKSQFIEMFANKYETVNIDSLATIIMGQSPSGDTYNTNQDGLPFYQGKADFGNFYINAPNLYTSKPTKIAEEGDVLLSIRAPVGCTNLSICQCCIGRGLAAIRPKENLSNQFYLLYGLREQENEIKNCGVGSTFDCISKNQIMGIKIYNAPFCEQSIFASFVNQIDKSKFKLKQLQEKLDILYKSLLQKYFG